MTRIALLLALLAGLATPARAGTDVGVIVTIVSGEGSMQPLLAAQIESWLSQHGHTLVPSPLPPESVTALIDCFVIDNQGGCAPDIAERRKSTSMVYTRVNTKSNASNGTRDVTLTVFWFDKGHGMTSAIKTCERCTDPSLRLAADDVMRKLVGGGDVGHIKLSSNPPGARITIDGQAIGVTPLDWDLPPGKHTIQMDKTGLKPATRDIVVASNKVDAVGLVLLPPGTGDGPGEADGQPSKLLPIAMIAAGGALLATGVVLYAIDEDPTQLYTTKKNYRDTAPAGVGLAIGGAVVAGVGTYLLLRSHGTTSTPVASLTGDSGYIGWLGQF